MGNVDRWMKVHPEMKQQMIGSDHFPTFRSEVRAFGSYASLGLLDPKNFVLDGPMFARYFGVSYLTGVAMASFSGAIVTGSILYLVDPQHKSRYGLDEFTGYTEHPYSEQYFR